MSLFGRKKPSQAGGEEPVTFKHRDARRIAKTVHAHETSRRQRSPSTLPRSSGGGGGFATAKFTGSWSKGSLKQITFLVSTTETAIATNIFSNISAPSEGHKTCAVAREGTSWVLIAAECQ